MGYLHAEIQKLRRNAAELVFGSNKASYTELRDAIITSYLPHTTNRSKDHERRPYNEYLEQNDNYLETMLYGDVWHDLLPNERIALEHLYYEDPDLVNADTVLHAAIHEYVEARNNIGCTLPTVASQHYARHTVSWWHTAHTYNAAPRVSHRRCANKSGSPPARQRGSNREAREYERAETIKQHLKNILWEILYNSLPDKSSIVSTHPELHYDKLKRRRKAQTEMFNTLNIPTVEVHTPDYVVEPIRRDYAATPIEELLPDIAFPIEPVARGIAEEIQAINGETNAQLMGQKSVFPDTTPRTDLQEIFVQLIIKNISDTHNALEDEIDKAQEKGLTHSEIIAHIERWLEHRGKVTIPYRIEQLSFAYNARLTLIHHDTQGIREYVWHTMRDEHVRPSHAANDGKLFRMDTPPPGTGHPGEDPGCRCWAVPPEDQVAGVQLPAAIIAAALRAARKRLKDAARKVEKKVPAVKPQSPKDILAPGGKPIGKQGDRKEVRIEKGGDKGARELYEKLSKDGTPHTPKNYPGEGKKLPNGDWVGYRKSSKSGSPTVDVNVNGVDFNKVHFPK